MAYYGVNGRPFLDLAPFIDLSGIQAVVGEVASYIERNPRQQLVAFSELQNVHPADAHFKHLASAIRLRRIKGLTADTLERADLAGDEPYAEDLPVTMNFLRQLPLKGVGRSSIYFTPPGMSVPVHRDYATYPGFNNQFIYLNPVLKPFFVLDATGAKHFIDTPASIFNPSDFHGMEPCDRLTFSIRVNGFFDDDLVEQTGLKEHFGDR